MSNSKVGQNELDALVVIFISTYNLDYKKRKTNALNQAVNKLPSCQDYFMPNLYLLTKMFTFMSSVVLCGIL